MIRVMIVDDEAPFRYLLKVMAGVVGGMEVVAEADTAEDALSQLADTRPDLVLMDVRLACQRGLRAATLIREIDPHVRIVLTGPGVHADYRSLARIEDPVIFLPKRDITTTALRRLAAI